jgi:hypothetical protein
VYVGSLNSWLSVQVQWVGLGKVVMSLVFHYEAGSLLTDRLCHLAFQKGVCAVFNVVVKCNRRFAVKSLQCFGCVR